MVWSVTRAIRASTQASWHCRRTGSPTVSRTPSPLQAVSPTFVYRYQPRGLLLSLLGRFPIGYNSPLWPVGLRGEWLLPGAPYWLIMEKWMIIANRFLMEFGGLPKRGRGLS